MRVSFVLAAGLLLALTARRNAALRHAILVAGLAAAFIMPAAMLTMQVLPVSRWQLGLLGRVGLDDSAAVAVVSSRPPSEPHHRPASLDHPAPAIVRHEKRRGSTGSRARCVRAVGRVVPRASRTERVECARRAIDGQRPALGVAARGDRQGDRARVSRWCACDGSWRGRVPSPAITSCPYSG